MSGGNVTWIEYVMVFRVYAPFSDTIKRQRRSFLTINNVIVTHREEKPFQFASDKQ